MPSLQEALQSVLGNELASIFEDTTKEIDNFIDDIALPQAIAEEKKELFDTEGSIAGEKWQDLAESTKKRKKSGYKILQDSKTLYTNMINPSNFNKNNNYKPLIDEKYLIHQTGRTNPTSMPARPFYEINDKEIEIIKNNIIKRLKEKYE